MYHNYSVSSEGFMFAHPSFTIQPLLWSLERFPYFKPTLTALKHPLYCLLKQSSSEVACVTNPQHPKHMEKSLTL